MVSLVVISHSPQIAAGLLELTGELAKGAKVYAVGGTKSGALGADFDSILEKLVEALAEGDVIVLADLGSTWMTAGVAVEALEPGQRQKVYLSPAALVEGTIAAAAAIGAGFGASDVLEQLEPLNLPK